MRRHRSTISAASAIAFALALAVAAASPAAADPAPAPTEQAAEPDGFNAGATASAIFFCPARATVGDSFPVVLSVRDGRTIAPPEVSLYAENGRRVARSVGFRLELARDTTVWIALFALDSFTEPGTYRATIAITPDEAEPGATETGELTVAVLSRDFFSEQIPLDEAMSDLRATPDPQKDEQSRRLVQIVSEFHPGAVYQDGAFSLPVVGARETSHFGDRRVFVYSDGGRARSVHYGLDLALPTGTPVHAAASGRVVFADRRILTGNTVIIEHLPGVFGLYYHLSAITVAEGERVATGDLIGRVGATGLVTGPHLHWEVRVNGVPVEPETLLERGIVDTRRLFGALLRQQAKIYAVDEGR